MNTIKYAETVKFYKKTAELQVKLLKPEADESGKITKEGCLFFEMAQAIPGDTEGRIDWKNKIIMKIGINDLGALLNGIRYELPEVKLFHKTASGTSTFTLAKGQNPGTYGVSLYKVAGEQKLQARMYLNSADLIVLEKVLEAGLPVILGWS